MTDNEVNKIIAKFMDENHYEMSALRYYTKSLDALVPVWEKLGNDRFYFNFDLCSTFCVNEFILEDKKDTGNGSKNYHSQSRDSIQQAAAHATAKAILELSNVPFFKQK